MARRPGLPALLLAAGALVAANAPAATEVPFLSGRVNDYANMLSEAERGALESKLADLERQTGAQVAVLTVDTLGDEPIEDFSMRVVETWKLGQKGKNNGVLVLVAKGDRKMRIEVGYGLEGALTDATCSRIVNEVMRPRFRAGEFGPGITAAADAVAGFVRGESPLPAEAPAGSGGQELSLPGVLVMAFLFTVTVGVFSVIAVFAPGCASWFLYAFLMPFYFAFPSAIGGVPVGATMLGAWVLGFPLAKLFLYRTPAGKAWLKSHPGWAKIGTSSGHGGSSGGGWSSSSSSGGFSGGGGSFGGGGASGSW